MMWFQAREQEKKIRGIMVDTKKRAERRRKFYDSIKRDPIEFMQVHGRRSKIHIDSNIARQANSKQTFRTWQGDENIEIDRFDARAHLDYIPKFIREPSPDNSEDNEVTRENRKCNYERYRLLVVNEYEGISEGKALKKIHIEENHGGINPSTLIKEEKEKKKQLEGKKAAISFNYNNDGSTTEGASSRLPEPPPPADDQFGSDSDEEEEDIALMDVTLDVTSMRPEKCRELNKISLKYGMIGEDFVKLMWEDKEECDRLDEIRRIEASKAALAGRQSRRERQILKQKRLLMVGKTHEATTSLRHHRVWSPETKYTRPSGDSSSSPSPSPTGEGDEEGKVEYITSFQDTAMDKDGDVLDKDSVQGPAPPPPQFKKELRKKNSESPELKTDWNKSSRGRSRSRSLPRRSHHRSRSRSYDESASKSRRRASRRSSRSPPPSSRSRRSRSGSHRRSYRRPSLSRDRRRDWKGYSRDRRSRSTSRSTKRRRRKSSSSTSSRSPTPKKSRNGKSSHGSSAAVDEQSKRKQKTERSPPRVMKRSRSKSSHEQSSDSTKSTGDSALSELSIRSDLSSDEQQRRQVENRKRRMRKTKSKFKKQGRESRNSSSPNSERNAKTAKDKMDRLKRQRQKALKRTTIKVKEEQKEKQRSLARQAMLREEEIRERSALQRSKDRARAKSSESP